MSRELLQQALVHLENACMPAPSFLAEIRAHLAAQSAPAEPVAHAQNPKAGFWVWCLADEPGAIPLYAHPAAPVPVPLTDEQISEIVEQERMRWITSLPTYAIAQAFARAIERAHGIAASPEKKP